MSISLSVCLGPKHDSHYSLINPSLLMSCRKVQSAIATESTRPSATAPKKESAGQAQYMNWGFARPTGAGTGVLPSAGVGKGESKAAPVSGLTDYDRQPMSEPSQSRRPHTASVSRPGAVVSRQHRTALYSTVFHFCFILCFDLIPHSFTTCMLLLSAPYH